MDLTSIDDPQIKKLQELIMSGALSQNYKKTERNKFQNLKAEKWDKLENKDLFLKNNLNPLKPPTESVLIKGRPQIGKTLLTESWKVILDNRLSTIKSYRLKYSAQGLIDVYYKTLAKYTNVYLQEMEVKKYFNDIHNTRDGYLDKVVNKKYVFIDDIFSKENWTHSDKQLAQDCERFWQDLYSYLSINKDNIIVIATTNNKASEVMERQGQDLEENKLFQRVKQIFKKENVFDLK